MKKTKLSPYIALSSLLLTLFLMPTLTHASVLLSNFDTPTTTITLNGGSNLSAFPTSISFGGGDLYLGIDVENGTFVSTSSANGGTVCFTLNTYPNSGSFSSQINADMLSNDGGLTWDTINPATCVITAGSNLTAMATGTTRFVAKYSAYPATSTTYFGFSGYYSNIAITSNYLGNHSGTEFYTGSFFAPADTYGCLATTAIDAATCGLSIPSADAQFIFPTSTYEGPDFTNWTLHVSNMSTSSITYLQTTYTNGTSWNGGVGIYMDYPSAIYPSAATSVDWTIHKKYSLFSYQNNNVATSSWTAVVQTATTTDGNGNPLFSATTSQITFVISPVATTTPTGPGSTSSGPFYWFPGQQTPTWPPTTPTSSSQLANVQCVPAADWTDIGGGLSYGLCSVLHVLLIPSQYSMDFMASSVAAFKTVPPLVYFFAPIGSLQSSSQQAETITAIVYNAYFNLDGSTSSVVIAPTDWASSGTLFQIRQAWFNIVLGTITLLFVLLVAKFIL